MDVFCSINCTQILHLKLKPEINEELIESMVQKCTKLQKISIFGLNDCFQKDQRKYSFH
jgi:hypothetical protein